MQTWRTKFYITQESAEITTRDIFVKRSIFQSEILSPLWFCLALKPLSSLLNKSTRGFQIKQGKKSLNKLSPLLYVDDLKLYAGNEEDLKKIKVTKNFSIENVKK